MPRKGFLERSIAEVPDADLAVVAARDKPGAIGADREGMDMAGMIQLVALVRRPGLEHACRAVQAARDYGIAAGGEDGHDHRTDMPLEDPNKLAARHIEEPRVSVPSWNQKRRAIGAEAHCGWREDPGCRTCAARRRIWRRRSARSGRRPRRADGRQGCNRGVTDRREPGETPGLPGRRQRPAVPGPGLPPPAIARHAPDNGGRSSNGLDSVARSTGVRPDVGSGVSFEKGWTEMRCAT